MTTVVSTCWGPREIDEQICWHLVSPTGLFYHNVRVGKGALLSVSAGIEAEPEIKNAQTPYSLGRIGDPKEALFEEIRRTNYPTRPPRLKTLYVFDDYSLVQRAINEWFVGGNKVAHECRLLLGSITHRSDAVWLNARPENWQVSAHNYWQSRMSGDPFPEVLVHGALYFPGWEEFPSA